MKFAQMNISHCSFSLNMFSSENGLYESDIGMTFALSFKQHQKQKKIVLERELEVQRSVQK